MKDLEKYNEKIKKFRKEIDLVDFELLKTFKKRFDIVKEVGELKKEFKIKPLQKDRWGDVLHNMVKKGEKSEISKEFIIDIWERVHKESLKIEE